MLRSTDYDGLSLSLYPKSVPFHDFLHSTTCVVISHGDHGRDAYQLAGQPLLGAHNYAGRPRWRFWPTFTTTAARYRFIPLLGCLLIFINDSSSKRPSCAPSRQFIASSFALPETRTTNLKKRGRGSRATRYRRQPCLRHVLRPHHQALC
jgi:hypothetical protein